MARGTVYVDARFKDQDTGNALVFGRVLLGASDIINPRDLGLSSIKSIVFTAWDAVPTSIVPGSSGSMVGKNYDRSNPRLFSIITGSIGSAFPATSLSTGASPGTAGGNYVRVTSLRLRSGALGSAGRGAVTLGTHPGSLRASFWAVGR